MPSTSQVTRLAALEAQIVKQDASSNESSSDVDEGDAFEEGRYEREGSGLVREDTITDDVGVLSAATAQAEDQWLGTDGVEARCVSFSFPPDVCTCVHFGIVTTRLRIICEKMRKST